MRMSSKKPSDTVTPSLRKDLFFSVVHNEQAPATAFDLSSDHLVLLRSEHKQPESDLGIALISYSPTDLTDRIMCLLHFIQCMIMILISLLNLVRSHL